MKDLSSKYMEIAIKLALKGAGKVSPNPMVGAVIVKNGVIIGKGYHKAYGQNHAEVNAFESCVTDPAGADMYVTLEPCCHFGKTPPCTGRIIREKIKRVFIGSGDPSPHAAGKGIVQLKNAGIEVVTGVCEKECTILNAAFLKFATKKTPLIVIKAAVSADGCMAADSGDSKWITNEKSRKYSHRLRSFYDAVLVGKNTVINDDPELTVRHVKGRNPVRIVLDSRLEIPSSEKVFDGTSETIVISSNSADNKTAETFLKDRGITVLKVDMKDGFLDLKTAFMLLGERKITSVMAEGGGTIHSYLLNNRIADRLNLFTAPVLIGSGKRFFSGSDFSSVDSSIWLDIIDIKHFGDDIFTDAFLRYRD